MSFADKLREGVNATTKRFMDAANSEPVRDAAVRAKQAGEAIAERARAASNSDSVKNAMGQVKQAGETVVERAHAVADAAMGRKPGDKK